MSAPKNADPLVKELLALLKGGNAHASLDKAVEDFPEDLRGTAPHGLPYSAWQLLEHLRLAQRDILEFSSPPPGGYKSLEWPKDYWPTSLAPPNAESWDESFAAIQADQKRFADLLSAPDADLYAPFPWGEGQNLLREVLLIADHNSYHVGELIVLRRLLGIWKS